MSDLWANSYKGAVYPVDLTAKPYGGEGDGKCVKTLLDLSAHLIVRDAQATLNAIKVVPPNICYSLMKAALLENRDRTVHVLISRWPFDVLSLKALAPPLFASVLPLYSRYHQRKMSLLGVRFTTIVAHAFTRSLKTKGEMKLKYLDLTGFVAIEVVTEFMASHCLLAHNEARSKMAICMYEKATQLGGASLEYKDLKQIMPDGFYGVKLDVFVNSANTHSDLCKALVVSGYKCSTFKLFLNKLDATFLGEVKLKILLDLINPVHLTGLRLQFNSLGEHGILYLVDSISRLTNLTALDFSCNGIQFFNSQNCCDKVAAMLSSLPHLIRLDLSNNRVKTRLRQLLANLPQALEHLTVAGCSLSVSDLTYLSVSHHASGLQELDLSDNWSVGKNCPALMNLLSKLAKTLMVLEVQNCGLGDADMTQLVTLFPSLIQLRFLNLCCNELTWDTSEDLIKSTTFIPHIQALQISYPCDCDNKALFGSSMTNFIKDHKCKTGSGFDLSLMD